MYLIINFADETNATLRVEDQAEAMEFAEQHDRSLRGYGVTGLVASYQILTPYTGDMITLLPSAEAWV